MSEQAKSGGKAAPKKKLRKGVTRGVAHVCSTFNNTMVTITDTNGETISWASAGTVGFKGGIERAPRSLRVAPLRRLAPKLASTAWLKWK